MMIAGTIRRRTEIGHIESWTLRIFTQLCIKFVRYPLIWIWQIKSYLLTIVLFETGSLYFHIRRDFNIIEPSRVEIRPRQRISSYQKWMPFVCLAILLSCLSLSHAIIITDGFYKTCDHYRVMLIQVLGSTGREAEVRLDINLAWKSS